MKFLVVDDCETMVKIMKGLLVALGHGDVDVAHSAKHALKLIKSNDYEVVFTDWNMPEMSGIELIELVRSTEKLKHQIIILVSAETTKEQIEEAHCFLVDDFIAKPLNRETLQKKLNKVTHEPAHNREELIDLCHQRLVDRLAQRIEGEPIDQLAAPSKPVAAKRTPAPPETTTSVDWEVCQPIEQKGIDTQEKRL